jgi:hypothetical protein
MHLLAIQGPVAVHHVHGQGVGLLLDLVQRLVQERRALPRDGHEVDRRVVALVGRVAGNVDRLVHVLDVRGHADELHDGLLGRQDILGEGLVGVQHDGNLRVAGVDAVGGRPQVRLVAEPPGPVVGRREVLLAVAVAQLDIVDSRLAGRLVYVADRLKRELGVVDQPPVTDRAIHHLYLRTVHSLAPLMHSLPRRPRPRGEGPWAWAGPTPAAATSVGRPS